MGISIYQIILGLIALIFIINGILRFAKGEKYQTLFKLFSTLLIWGVIFVFSIFPEFSHFISTKIGLGENLNTLIFIGFVMLFIIIFKLLNTVENLERDITEIVRNEALNKINK